MALKQFPFDRLQIRRAVISSSLNYNQGYPPKVRWAIGIETEPLELGADAAYPDLETTIDSPILLDELELDIHDWRQLAGRHEFADQQNGTYYVSSGHIPADVVSLDIQSRSATSFDVTASVRFDFEFEGAGYKNETVLLKFPAIYEGFVFHVPQWTDPTNRAMPPEYRIPSMDPDWTDVQILDFVARFIDFSLYDEPILTDGKSVKLQPKRNNAGV